MKFSDKKKNLQKQTTTHDLLLKMIIIIKFVTKVREMRVSKTFPFAIKIRAKFLLQYCLQKPSSQKNGLLVLLHCS